MKVTVYSRKDVLIYETDVELDEKLSIFRHKYAHEKQKNFYRQRFTVKSPDRLLPKPNKISKKAPSLALTDETKTWKEYGFTSSDHAILYFKDLGPQVGWRTVFLVEYFGPMLMHAIPYFFPKLIYGEDYKNKDLIQIVSFWLVIFHYMKREFETIFIHRFSNGTMPIFNIFKNSFHYWFIGGFFISYYLYHPRFTPLWKNENIIYSLAGGMVLMELGNLFSHITLRNLRPPGTKERRIPFGGLFNLVSCANYTYEVAAWGVFAFLTNCLTAWIFLGVSFGQMTIWALKKHKQYKKQFNGKYPRNRTAIIPFIL